MGIACSLYWQQWVRGCIGLLLHVFQIGLYFYLVDGLWKLRERARRIAIGYHIYVLLAGTLQVFAHFGSYRGSVFGPVLTILIWNLVVSGTIISILLVRKSAFQTPPV